MPEKNTLSELIDIAKHVPVESLEKAINSLREIIDEADKHKSVPTCPHCGANGVVRNGHKDGRQRYLCHGCGKAFNETTGTTMSYSHSSDAVWTQVVSDTLNGVAISDTASALDLSREVVFNMRHKILLAMETEERTFPTVLEGVCELDETFVLESMKGSKLPDEYWRKARKHGAKARKRGLSNEQICICAGVSRDNEEAISLTVNRATPSSEEITAVFGGRLADGTLILCDGAKGYGVLEKENSCSIASASGHKQNKSGFYNINSNVNNLASSGLTI